MINIKLRGSVVEICRLGQPDIQRMYDLMSMHYDNILFSNFQKDLDEKNWAVVMSDEGGEIQGFSTIKFLEFFVEGVVVRGLFSGDTIVHKDYWGDREFPKVWLKFALSISEKYPKGYFYWFLISKGYKTYRFLPIYFNSFYPRYDKETPEFEKKVIDYFGTYKFEEFYNPKTGIITFNGTKDMLKKGIADITESRLKDPHIRYFAEKNTGYMQGDEMVCIAELRYDNMNGLARRFLLGGGKE